jgi:D-lyxose ketol-isomerase
MMTRAGITLTVHEKENVEIADFGLGDFRNIGLAIVTYVNNERYCAKELVLLPGQICPEHRHPSISSSNPGKTETFRCRRGVVTLYTEGPPSSGPSPRLPAEHGQWLVVRKRIVLKPGEQYTIPADTLHWFQAGPSGAVVSEFSSPSLDEKDIFTDPRIRRMPEIEAD